MATWARGARFLFLLAFLLALAAASGLILLVPIGILCGLLWPGIDLAPIAMACAVVMGPYVVGVNLDKLKATLTGST